MSGARDSPQLDATVESVGSLIQRDYILDYTLDFFGLILFRTIFGTIFRTTLRTMLRNRREREYGSGNQSGASTGAGRSARVGAGKRGRRCRVRHLLSAQNNGGGVTWARSPPGFFLGMRIGTCWSPCAVHPTAHSPRQPSSQYR
eukprot:2934364-Pyramimonas_sp.AAC.1